MDGDGGEVHRAVPSCRDVGHVNESWRKWVW